MEVCIFPSTLWGMKQPCRPTHSGDWSWEGVPLQGSGKASDPDLSPREWAEGFHARRVGMAFTELLSSEEILRGCCVRSQGRCGWWGPLGLFGHVPCEVLRSMDRGQDVRPLGSFHLFYWNIVDLQCCVNFCCMAMWISYVCVCVYIYTHTHSFSYAFPLRFIPGYWIQFPVLYSRTLFIHPIYNRMF